MTSKGGKTNETGNPAATQFIKGGGSIFMLALIEINLANIDSC